MTEPVEAIEGRRLVVYLYGVVVAVATAMGFAIGIIRPEGLDPELFGVLQLPPTPLGMAAYGGLTLAALLGVLLGAIVVLSNRYATE